MYSRKVLVEALAEAPDAGASWAFFPVECAQGGCGVWVVPEKLKLLRLLGLEYAVHKKKKAPPLIHAGVEGLLVDEAPVGEGGGPRTAGDPLRPDQPPALTRPSVMVGAAACTLSLSRERVLDIDLQQWLDALLEISCPTPLSAGFPARLRELCDDCRGAHGLGDGALSTNAGSHLVRYQCKLEASQDRAPDSGEPLREGAGKDFSLSLRFAQIETDHALALVHLELDGQAGAAAKYLYEFAAEAPLLAFLEDRLRDFLHDRRPRLLPGEDSLAEVEKLLAESGEEAAQGFSVVDVVAGAAFLDLAREQERAAERWRNIRR